MKSYQSLYKRVLKAAVQNKQPIDLKSFIDADQHQLECLLNPEKCSAVIRLQDCPCDEKQKAACANVCDFDAISRDEEGNIAISDTKCIGCGACIAHCKLQNLTDRKEFVPLFNLLHNSAKPIYALVAPAFISQFGEDVTPGMLRSALKALGFAGMIEVALFADILTLKEALEFDQKIVTDEDYLLTSCCCPIWIAMIKRIYTLLIPHLPPSVSPMVACGRAIKKLYPEAVTVFIGPCLAKKTEAREKDIADAVDYVLTFKEVEDIFAIAELNVHNMVDDVRSHSSQAGRTYARTGGVSEAVQRTLAYLRPERTIEFKAKQAQGVPACKALLNDIKNQQINANFLEGMGCVGGCVGGPRAILNKDEASRHVNSYGEEAVYKTPVDNPYVMELLERLGFYTIDSLVDGENMFTRKFDNN